MLGDIVTVTVDRPLGSFHPEYKNLYYPVNYGYVKGISAPDGEEQDAYIIGVNKPVQEFTGKLIAVVHRRDDVEEKWVVAPEGLVFHKKEIEEQIKFQEQYFRPEIIALGDVVLETRRLYLREMNQSDYGALRRMLQDEDVMYAYNGVFTDQEIRDWLARQIDRYYKDGFGLWAVVLKKTGKMIGQCGLSIQPWKDRRVLEIGYLFQKAFWHKGYAAEAAKACKEYAFTKLSAEEVFSIIRNTNIASQNVALRNGMTMIDTWMKNYRGTDMLHILYSVKRTGEGKDRNESSRNEND